MRLAVFGATGRTGVHVVDQALAGGHDVTVLVRDGNKLGSRADRVTVVEGDVREPADVARAVKDVAAIVSVLGPVRGGPHDVFRRGTRAIVDAAHAEGLARIVALTGAGVDVAGDRKGVAARLASGIVRLFAREVVADRQAEYEILRDSGLEWTLARTPRLSDGPLTGTYRVGDLQLGMSAKISRADAAHFLLTQIADDRYVRQAPFISY